MRSKVCFDKLYDERKKTAQAVFFDTKKCILVTALRLPA